MFYLSFFFFSSRRRHTRSLRDWSSDVCSSDLGPLPGEVRLLAAEVAVGGGLRVDRAEQVKVPDDRRGAEIEDLEHRVLDAVGRHPLGAEALDEQPDRLRLADRVGDLGL